ncbi:MAG: hypothetical protein AAGA27_05885 [Pseudomonadota bacterium]
MKEDLIHYIQQQLRTTPDRLKRFTHGIDGQKYPQRFLFIKVSQL